VKTLYYKKEGRKYIPVSEYDSDMMDAVPLNSSILVQTYKGGQSRRYSVDPALAPMVAACMVFERDITTLLAKASEFKPKEMPITQAQRDAWTNMQNEFGGRLCTLEGPSMSMVAENLLKVMNDRALEMMKNEATKQAYEHFLTIAALSK
jgi:hypothetical protein